MVDLIRYWNVPMNRIKRSQVSLADEVDAVAALAQDLLLDETSGVIFFCSSRYNLERLAHEISTTFSCPVVGCTTSGEIADSYHEGGIVGVSFSAQDFLLTPYLISNLSHFESQHIETIVTDVVKRSVDNRFVNSVGYLLIDGLSLAEERVSAALSGALGDLPLVGGSAGDEFNFEQTYVYFDGSFQSDAAVFTLISTSLDIEVCKLQHILPTDKEVVVTESDPKTRIVYELDGEPAVDCYSRYLDLRPDQLTPDIFSRNPVMLQVCGDWYVRSIQSANYDGSLTFYCAIESGLPLTISRSGDIVKSFNDSVIEFYSRFSEIELTLACDCILRRLEIINDDKKKEAIAPLFKKLNLLGFNTYGEQFNSLHLNQTLTCIIFGTLNRG